MKDFQKVGGLAALIEALTYIIGFAMVFTLMADYTSGTMSNQESLAFLASNYDLLYVWHLLIYVVNGVFLVVLALALYERLKADAPALIQTATAFGLIWAGLVIASGMLILLDLKVIADVYAVDPAQAEIAQITLGAVERGLGGGIELVGGVWVLLVSWAAMRRGGLPLPLNILGVIIGVAGILTLIRPIADVGAVFGLGFILWFAWAGIVMLRGKQSAVTASPKTAIKASAG